MDVQSTDEPKIASSRKQNYLNPSYFFSDMASLSEIVKLAKSIKQNRIFVIQSFKSIEETLHPFNVQCESQDIFVDHLEQLPEKVTKARNSLHEGDAKIFHIKWNEATVSMLVLHSDCSKPKSKFGALRKSLGVLIEKESFIHLQKFFELNISFVCNTQRSGKRKSENPEREKEKRAKLTFKSNCEETTVFPTQEKIAHKLFNMIKSKMFENSNIDIEKEFDDFKFLILLPNRTSLEDQTKNRIHKYSGDCLFLPNDRKSVLRIIQTANANAKTKWECFVEQAKRNHKTLYLVVHDECHWAAGTKCTFDFFGFQKGDYHYDEEGKPLKNLFTLMVSATPYNFFTVEKMESFSDVLNWNQYLKIEKVNNTYKGLSEFRKESKIVACDLEELNSNWNKLIDDQLASLLLNGFSKEFILVILDYLSALYRFKMTGLTSNANSFPTTQTVQESVFKCIEDKNLIVVRLQSARDEIRQSNVAKDVLMSLVNSLSLEIEIVVWPLEEKKTFMSEEHMEIALETCALRINKKNANISDIQISDFQGIPMILFIVEQCRMGDTFPSPCACFDLRPRYLDVVNDFTSIIQDVGRAFGYGARPTLFLSKEANEFLKIIWNAETSEISYEDLKKGLGLKNAMLGPNMKRKAVVECPKPIEEKEKKQPTSSYLSEIELEVTPNLPKIFMDCEDDDNETSDTPKSEEVVKLFQDIYEACDKLKKH